MRRHTCQNKCVKNIFSWKGIAFSQGSCLLTKEEALRSLLQKVYPCHRKPSPLDPPTCKVCGVVLVRTGGQAQDWSQFQAPWSTGERCTATIHVSRHGSLPQPSPSIL